MKKNNASGTSKVVLKDTKVKTKKDSVKGKRAALVGQAFDDLNAKKKDDLLKALLEHVGWLENGVVV